LHGQATPPPTFVRPDAAMAATQVKAEFITIRLAATLSLGGAG